MNGCITKEEIKELIYEIRDKKVMLASDLAKLFEMETKNINKTVKRNIDIFSEVNYFQLTKNEYEKISLRFQNGSSRFQFGTLNNNENGRGSNIKYLPYVFTSEGISILSTILKSEEVKETIKLILEVYEEENNALSTSTSLYLREENIKLMIHNIRGKRVILDEDIAKLFQYETKMLNRQVIRNKDRFPENYCFQLTEEEYNINLRCQNGTSSYGGRRYLPYAFTEYGVIMLTSILKSKVAIEASIRITNTFIEMRKIVSEELIEEKFYKNLILQNTEDIKKINETLKSLAVKDLKEKIFFDGEIYDAYSKILDILSIAKKELIIIDGYADKNVLDMISKLKVNVTLITKQNNKLKEIDIKKYKEQYNNLTIIYNKDFHDRFIIIDEYLVYHLGTSINYAGSKVFAINILEEKELIEKLINKINNIKRNNKV